MNAILLLPASVTPVPIVIEPLSACTDMGAPVKFNVLVLLAVVEKLKLLVAWIKILPPLLCKVADELAGKLKDIGPPEPGNI